MMNTRAKKLHIIWGTLLFLGTLIVYGVNPCIPHAPEYGDWILEYCPYVTNSPGLQPSALCGNVGDAPCLPTITPPIFAPGLKYRAVSDGCSSWYEYANINYDVGGVNWDPPLPSEWEPSDAITGFQSEAYFNIISDDTLCPSHRENIGSATWNVVDPNDYAEQSIDVNLIASAIQDGYGKIAKVINDISPSCEAGPVKIEGGPIVHKEASICCDCQAGTIKTKHELEVNAISLTVSEWECAVPSLSIPVKVTKNAKFIAGFFVFSSGSGSVGASLEADPCAETKKLCFNASLNAEFGLRLAAVVALYNICNVHAHVDGSVTGEVKYECCEGNGTVSGGIGKLTVTGLAEVKFFGIACKTKPWKRVIWPGIKVGPLPAPCPTI